MNDIYLKATIEIPKNILDNEQLHEMFLLNIEKAYGAAIDTITQKNLVLHVTFKTEQ